MNAPPSGELFSETSDISVAVLLSYGTARDFPACDAEAREDHVAVPYRAHTPGDAAWHVMIAGNIQCTGNRYFGFEL